jgi:hypothetical protein
VAPVGGTEPVRSRAGGGLGSAAPGALRPTCAGNSVRPAPGAPRPARTRRPAAPGSARAATPAGPAGCPPSRPGSGAATGRQAVTALTKSPANFSVPDGVGSIGPRATRSRERQRDLRSAELAADLATEAAELRLTCPDRRSKGARCVSSHATLVSGLSQEKKTRSSPLLRMG